MSHCLHDRGQCDQLVVVQCQLVQVDQWSQCLVVDILESVVVEEEVGESAEVQEHLTRQFTQLVVIHVEVGELSETHQTVIVHTDNSAVVEVESSEFVPANEGF